MLNIILIGFWDGEVWMYLDCLVNLWCQLGWLKVTKESKSETVLLFLNKTILQDIASNNSTELIVMTRLLTVSIDKASDKVQLIVWDYPI